MISSKHSSKPKQYLDGFVEWYKLKFKVTPDVLIPRPETELLVDETLNFLQTTNSKLITILDIGTGSGNIAISLAKNISHLKGITIIATDVSEKALTVAKQNAKLHGVSAQITFLKSDLLTVFDSSIINHKSSIILVTNLPYIPSKRIPTLDSSVKDFEPYIALDGGMDGFELYRKLFQQILELKLKPKLIVAEIDYTQGEIAKLEAKKYFSEAEVEVKLDLAGKQRILRICETNRQGS